MSGDSFEVRDRRSTKWCWQDRAALDRIRAGLSHPEINGVSSGLAIYVSLTARADQSEQCWPKMLVLARDAGVSGNTARRRLADLEKLGLITITNCIGPDGDTSNTYTLLDTPEDPPAPDWHTITTGPRTLVRLEDQPRIRKSATSPSHRHSNHWSPKTSAALQPLESQHRNSGRPGLQPLESTPPMVAVPLTGVLTNQSEQEERNEMIQPDLKEQLPTPAGKIDPPGMPASQVWAAIVDSLTPQLTDNTLRSLKVCYLTGDSEHLQAVAPSFAIARTLDAKTAPAIRQAFTQIIGSTTRFSFYLGVGK